MSTSRFSMRPLTLLRRRIVLHRRGLAALLAALGVYVALQATAPPPATTVSVWTAARDLPSGTVLGPDDLARTAFSPGSVPTSVVRTSSQARQLMGRSLAIPLSRGEFFGPQSVVRSGWLEGHPGLSAVPVRITDPAVVRLLRVGDRVAVVSVDPQAQNEGSELVPEAEVLAVPRSSDLDSSGGLQGRLVLLGIPTDRARYVASASAASFLTVLWNR